MLKRLLFKRYNAVKEATKIVDSHVALLQALYESKKTRRDAHSRLLCSCRDCQSDQNSTLAWIASLREDRKFALAKPARR